MANGDLDEELLEQQSIEQEQAENFAAAQQQERMQRIQQEQLRQQQQRSTANRAQKVGETAQKAQKWIKRYEKTGVVLEFLAASFPVWGPILGVLVAAMFVIIVLIAGCNQTGLTGVGVRVISKIGGVFSADICKNLTFNGGASGGAGASGTAGPMDIVITSAFRPGAIVAGTSRLSAHGRGEAIDIALRNPTVPKFSTDSRIAELVQIVKSAGFTPLAGDTLDEYTTSLEGTTGGHIHIEFNTQPNGRTYCDDTVVKNPPTDLVSIPASIPVDRGSTSDARLRPCMLNAITAIFNATTPAPVP